MGFGLLICAGMSGAVGAVAAVTLGYPLWLALVIYSLTGMTTAFALAMCLYTKAALLRLARRMIRQAPFPGPAG